MVASEQALIINAVARIVKLARFKHRQVTRACKRSAGVMARKWEWLIFRARPLTSPCGLESCRLSPSCPTVSENLRVTYSNRHLTNQGPSGWLLPSMMTSGRPPTPVILKYQEKRRKIALACYAKCKSSFTGRWASFLTF